MLYKRMAIEIESPEELGYGSIRCNLAESSMRDRVLGDLELDVDLASTVLLYGDHRGNPGLRALLAEEAECDPSQVLLTPGAAGALFFAATSLLRADDHLVVLRPNYGTNIETPRAIGCNITFVDLSLERGFRYTADDIMAAMTPRTRLVSITNPHNPTGVVLAPEELHRIVQLVESRDAWLLVDETYRDLTIGAPAPMATRLSERVISVASLSKAYGMPGLRLGWLITRSAELAELFLAAKEQIVITGPVIEEEIGFRFYRRRTAELARVSAAVKQRRDTVAQWIAQQPRMEWVPPAGGVVAFPGIRCDSGVDIERFYKVLNDTYGTYVGPGHWFEQDRRFMRVGFGWPEDAELLQGLESIDRALLDAGG